MSIENQITQTIKKYNLIGKNEKILVALSGGKDSTVCSYILNKLGYKIEGFHINLGLGSYSERCEKAVKELCTMLDIKLHLYDFKKENGSSMCYLRGAIQGKKKLKNCAICGVIKKWILNKEARKLKMAKIATGHHLDDESQTFFLNILKGSPQLSANSGPITKNIPDKKFVTRIKPLFYVLEEDIKEYSKSKNLPVVYESCPCAIDSYRIQVRKFFKTLSNKEKKNILKNFEEIQKQEKTQYKKINYCEICGEPARNKICKKCELMEI
jgi:tRNA-5-methyluridine54 2-sulfurtransferase